MPETLIPALDELERGSGRGAAPTRCFGRARASSEGATWAADPLYEARRFAPDGRRILLKREDLCHTGAHKINNALGQACSRAAWASSGSSRRRARDSTAWRRRPSARASGSSASCTWARKTCAAALERLAHEATRGRGARSRADEDVKDATNEAIRDWVTNVDDDLLPHRLVRRPASVPRDGPRVPERDRHEAREQCSRRGRLPDDVVACVGGGSNAIGHVRAASWTTRTYA